MQPQKHSSVVLWLILVIGAALILYVGFAGAVEDPEENWCFNPERWGDGRCADEDPWIRNWYYTCGWYRAAIDRGELVLQQIPEMCRRPLPPASAISTSTAVTPEPTQEVTPEPTQEVTPEPTQEVTPEPTPEVTPEPTQEVTPEPTQEVTPEPTQEVTPEPTQEVTPEPTPEVTPEPVTVTASLNFCVYTMKLPLTDGAGTWAQLNLGGVPIDTTRLVFTFTEGTATSTGTFNAGNYLYFNIEFPGVDHNTLTNGTLQAFNASDILVGVGTIGSQTCT